MRAKFIGVAIITIALVALAWKVSHDKAPQTEITRGALYPGLLERLNDVTRIEIKSARNTTSLVREGETWKVANKDGFPATFAEVKRVILQIASLVTVEPKTDKAASYARIGVANIGDDKADGTLFEAYGADSKRLLGLIVGHERSKMDDQRYVRRMDEAQAWLVDGKLDLDADPIKWLDARIVDVDTARVRRVTLSAPDEPAVVIGKVSAKDNFFTLENVPAGLEAKSKATVSSIGAVLLDLRFNDVAAANKVAGLAPKRQVEVQGFDGLVVHIDQFEVDGKPWARFAFRFDPALVAPAEPLATTPPDGNTPPVVAAAASDKASSDDAGTEPTAAPAETVEQTVARLQAASTDWVYLLPDYKQRMVGKRLADLTQKPAEKSAAPAKPAS